MDLERLPVARTHLGAGLVEDRRVAVGLGHHRHRAPRLAAAAGEVVRDAAGVEVRPHLLATQPAEQAVATTCRPRWWSTEATLTPLPRRAG